jgi:hypothetical protein
LKACEGKKGAVRYFFNLYNSESQVIFAVFTVPAVADTPPSIICQTPFDDPDEVNGIAVDSDGNIIVAADEYIAKFDPECNELWTVEFYDSSANFRDVTVDPDDNIIAVGDLSYDGLVAKYNPGGTKLWHKVFDFDSWDWHDDANAVAVDSNGNIIVAGVSKQREVPWEDRWIVLKYNSNGNELWRDYYRYVFGAEEPNSEANDVAVDSSDNVIVTGEVEVHGGFYPDRQMLTIKYESDGDRMWIEEYGTVEDIGVDNSGRTVAVDSQDDIIT